jgi:hypothetical protein
MIQVPEPHSLDGFLGVLWASAVYVLAAPGPYPEEIKSCIIRIDRLTMTAASTKIASIFQSFPSIRAKIGVVGAL